MDKEKLKGYFYSNIATIFWSSFLLLGGGIFVAYYAHIEYMPDFDLKSSIAILAAAAVTATIITTVLLGVMVLPGAFWGNTWGAESSLKSYWTDEKGNKTFLGLCLWFALPLVSIYGASIAGFFIGWYALLIVMGIFGGFLLFVIFRRKLPPWHSTKEVLTLLGTTLIASAFIFVPLLLVLNMSLHEDASLRMPAWVAGILCGCFIIFVNVLAATTPKHVKPFYWHLGLSIITLFVVLSTFEKFHRVPVRVMELYKFGNIQTTELVMKKEACKSFAALGIEIAEQNTDICVAKNILILSRLGKEAYLKHGPEGHNIKFTIASDEIVSWAIRETKDGGEKK